ncbi:NPK1-related protein kinase 2 [Actinidia rufa]|uniref:mitogen-activated protein kinase kinase kinase n=1 Tax=Actinidia rufa TaxID=165716 RepID=A0A7J0FW87_9ERIC|nr:NPK1-related protein kinase 2 [Actinidia rufa]
MHDIIGSVRRSLVFRSPDGGGEDVTTAGTLVDKINSRIRRSRVFSKSSPPPPMAKDESPHLRWRKGELIGCGAFGRVYMGMNLESGELLAVKQVLIAGNSASKEKAQTHVSELEEEVKLLKNLSHPNIVRYLGTVREDGTLNILLEFVPGGSISSLLGKFGSFPESVIRMYTKQLLLGLDYLHKNGIMHRDIKGANILVDNKGCIKLADFGASKQVVELATISGTKSMKGTPYWMAPEVILQTGHSLEPELRPAACELLLHPFVTRESVESPVFVLRPWKARNMLLHHVGQIRKISNAGSMDICNLGSLSCSTVNFDKLAGSRLVWGANNSEDDMCQIDDKDEFVVGREEKSSSGLTPNNLNESFNPMCEPSDDWRFKEGKSLGLEVGRTNLIKDQPADRPAGSFQQSGKGDNILSIQCTSSLSEDDDEATESKIKAFLDEKALELKKLQTPLYEEFYNSFNAFCSPSLIEKAHDENSPNYLKLPPKSRSPNRVPSGTPSAAVDGMNE